MFWFYFHFLLGILGKFALSPYWTFHAVADSPFWKFYVILVLFWKENMVIWEFNNDISPFLYHNIFWVAIFLGQRIGGQIMAICWLTIVPEVNETTLYILSNTYLAIGRVPGSWWLSDICCTKVIGFQLWWVYCAKWHPRQAMGQQGPNWSFGQLFWKQIFVGSHL